MSTPTFQLYVKPGCPWCRLAEEYFDDHGYRYERIDVLKDRAAFAEMKRRSGQSYSPTLVVGDRVLPDFGPEELADFLREHHLEP